jgi:general secretion pathway protein K
MRAPSTAARRGPASSNAPLATGPRRGQARERGVALIIAVISIAVLTAVATEFVYTSRVDLQLAANQRDEVRAYYLARSGLGLSRLLLKFQKQLDSIQLPNLGGLAQQLGLPGMGGSPGGGGGLNIQLWKLAKVDCYLLQSLGTGEGEEDRSERRPRAAKDADGPQLSEAQLRRSFGGFEGCFDVAISAEDTKINLNQLNGSRPGALVAQLLAVLGDKRFEFLFLGEDANRVRTAPTDLLINIHDWLDDDDVQAALNMASLGGYGEVFLPGFSDENYGYDRYQPRYKTKNAYFDSLDELYLVHGVNDRTMAAFRDRFTVYTDLNSVINVDTDDDLLLWMAMLAVADPAKPDPRLQNPVFVSQLIQEIKAARLFSFLGGSSQQFVQVLGAAKVPLRSDAAQRISGKNTTFTLQVSGEAGAIRKTLTAVVRADDGLGKLLYWREN